MEKSFTEYQRKSSAIDSESDYIDSSDEISISDTSLVKGTPNQHRNRLKHRQIAIVQSSGSEDEDEYEKETSNSLEFSSDTSKNKENIVIQCSSSEDERHNEAEEHIEEDSDDDFAVVQKKQDRKARQILFDTSDSLDDKISDASSDSDYQCNPKPGTQRLSNVSSDMKSTGETNEMTGARRHASGTHAGMYLNKSLSMEHDAQKTGNDSLLIATSSDSDHHNSESQAQRLSNASSDVKSTGNSYEVAGAPYQTSGTHAGKYLNEPLNMEHTAHKAGNDSVPIAASSDSDQCDSKSETQRLSNASSGVECIVKTDDMAGAQHHTSGTHAGKYSNKPLDMEHDAQKAGNDSVPIAVSSDSNDQYSSKSDTQRLSNASSGMKSTVKTNEMASDQHHMSGTHAGKYLNKPLDVEHNAQKADKDSIPIDLTDSFDEIIEIKDEDVNKPAPETIKASAQRYFPSTNAPMTHGVVKEFQSLNISEGLKQNVALSFSDGVMKCQRLEIEIATLKKEITKTKGILKSVDLSNLPDRGVRLQVSVAENDKKVKIKEKELYDIRNSGWADTQKVSSTAHSFLDKENWSGHSSNASSSIIPSNNGPHTFAPNYGPQRHGQEAMETYKEQKSLTVDALKQLHGSIESCPGEDTLAEDPKGLKSNVTLMPHQKRALAWLSWRETQQPRGGILADDMGLGKTLTMISLVLKYLDDSERESSDEENEDEGIVKGGTLVVCPASLLNQWTGEVEKRCKRGVLDIVIHHGTNRATKPRHLVKKDIVITTYNLVRTESGITSGKRECSDYFDTAKEGVLHRIKWERVILDEAHIVRNHKSQQSIAVCQLKAKYRWALTGTPVQNTHLDLYALLKFLRCTPFDDYLVWRRWVDNKNAAGLKRLNTVMNSIMLRRTKAVLQQDGALGCLPEKETHMIDVSLDKEELAVYQKVLVFSRTLFAQFLHQKAEREQLQLGNYDFSSKPTYLQGNKPDNPFELNSELAALHKRMTGMPDVKSHEILVLLLRLRQICCHPGLIEAMLDEDSQEVDGIEDSDGLDMDLLAKLSDMTLKETNPENVEDVDKQVQEKVLSRSNPVFDMDRLSSKMQTVFEHLEKNVLNSNDKAVIVSQWTSMLNIMQGHLTKRGVKCQTLSGSVLVKDRMQIVDQFNKPCAGPQVLLLSLTAGGVGLNLIGGNHLFLFDLHWNPQLEAQACDRIYRVGQKKPVHIYKFVCQETIEQRIKYLQDRKLALATDILTGGAHKQATKLSLDDLKMLFSM